jgi:undecaprenyl-diphosphatase
VPLKSLDSAIFRAIHLDLKSPALDTFFFILTNTGRGEIQVALSLFTLLSAKTRQLFWMLVVAALPIGGLAQIFKKLVPRERPSHLIDARPMEDWLYNSFPSGHTTTSFAMATMIWLYFRGTRLSWVAFPAYLWAAGVGMSRIYVGVHWPTDVLAGAMLGISGAIFFFYLLRRMFASKGLTFQFPAEGDNPGVGQTQIPC